MSRSKWKLKHTVFSPQQLKRKVWDRDLTLEEGLIGSTYYVYNGIKFLKLKIDELKIGRKLGEFIQTRKHVKKETTKKSKKNKK